MENIFKQFREVTKNPHEFLNLQTNREQKIQQLVHRLYSNSIHNDDRNRNANVLSELVLDGMDEEQIWQQIELWNDSVWPKYVEVSSKFLSHNDEHFELLFQNYKEESQEDVEPQDELENEDSFDEDELGSEEMEEEEFEVKKTKQYKKTIVDDEFFKLREMEEFLNAEDKKEESKYDEKKNLDGKIDYFNDELSDEDDENVNYKDFFADDVEPETNLQSSSSERTKNRKLSERKEDEEDLGSEEGVDDEEFSNTNEEEQNSENEDNESNANATEEEDELKNKSEDGSLSENEAEQVKSSFERRQERLKRTIEEFEEEALSEKPWQLKGEILASGRPQNALLEEVLQFDATARPAPVITEETTLRLEDIIKLRIKDKAWDDVERKAKPVKTAQEFRKELVLNQEKSKESLAQIYERDYQKELDKLNSNRETTEEEPKAHKEIKALMKDLFCKLDALSNFHYTPKPVAPEPKIITNTPAVSMEEVAPLAMTDARLLAPEEVKDRLKGEVVGKSERTQTDKNRERRKKKTRQRAVYKAKEERDLKKQEMGIKLSSKEEKGKMMRQLLKHKNVEKVQENKAEGKAMKSSTAFFSHLQDKALKPRKTKAPVEASALSAKKLKL